ncbi:hypothetical protein GUJ93_ZPchr0006g44510 [Zizania palustris]|uniref:MO25-like protein n=1 Tax=Zizania palustris TaxID=103762 RepID=A0A8J5VJM4_ZIZPA|nr:hypothetical protein GUJ93_ZPchr0006g44510 [Zizania palustris]
MAGCLWPCVTGGATTADGGLFRSKARGPAELVRHARDLLAFVAENHEACGGKREHKMADLTKSIREMKSILYGNGEAEPVDEACSQLTKEFFQENTSTLHLLIVCLPYMDLETQKDVTQVTANLLRQKVDYRMVASDYLEENQDLLDVLMSGYDNMDIAIHYSSILRDCIRHQVAARYVLESQHMKKFFHYIQYPDFNIASDAFKTFKELLTRHRSTAAEFFSKNYDWFFPEFNSKLLSSSNYIIRRQAIQLLGDILVDKSNTEAMMRYVNSKDHLIILMNLLREQSKAIQVEAFRVFKLFTGNPKKPPEIVGILVTNKSKMLRFLADFIMDKGKSITTYSFLPIISVI